ncbi:MAG: hypothetical protein E7256_08715 [Lachnospiraceae bacterium]|nr:hypothetical protein [Lachnospiraceae bacterium]
MLFVLLISSYFFLFLLISSYFFLFLYSFFCSFYFFCFISFVSFLLFFISSVLRISINLLSIVCTFLNQIIDINILSGKTYICARLCFRCIFMC